MSATSTSRSTTHISDDDLATQANLDEGSMLAALRARYARDIIYVRGGVGDIILTLLIHVVSCYMYYYLEMHR